MVASRADINNLIKPLILES